MAIQRNKPALHVAQAPKEYDRAAMSRIFQSINYRLEGVERAANDIDRGADGSYNPSNVTETRTFDANSTTLDEIADVLGTLINDLKTHGRLA